MKRMVIFNSFGYVIMYWLICFLIEGKDCFSFSKQVSIPRARRIDFQWKKFGKVFDDPYHYMKNTTDPFVKQYVDDENEYVGKMMKGLGYDRMEKEILSELNGINEYSSHNESVVIGDFVYFVSNKKWYQSRGNSNLMILDVGELSKGHDFFQLAFVSPSDDGKYVAYSIDTVGSERFSLRFRKILDDHVEDLPDQTIEDTFYTFSWGHDNVSCLYTKVSILPVQPLQIYLHNVLSNSDSLVYQEDNLSYELEIWPSSSGKYIFILSMGHSTQYAHYVSSDRLDDVKVVIPENLGVKYTVDHGEDSFYVMINDESCVDFRVVSIPESSLSNTSAWKTLQECDTSISITGVKAIRDYILIFTIELENPQVRILKTNTFEPIPMIDLPDSYYYLEPDVPSEILGYERYFYELPYFDFTYQTLKDPIVHYRYKLDTHELIKLSQDSYENYDPDEYTTDRLYVGSNGVEIPMTIVYKNGLGKKPSPLLLHAYGAYGSIIFPEFEIERTVLLKRDVVFAICHPRGSGIKGQQWYRDGKLMSKKNTFHDLIACAEFLIEKKWTIPQQLAIEGRSAGGLTVSASFILRPDLFRLVIAGVPFVDVINTMLDPSSAYTEEEIFEWGDPNIEDAFLYMLQYDPYQNIKENGNYPTLLYETGRNDPRVSMHEPVKFIAKIRDVYANETNNHGLAFLKTHNYGHFLEGGAKRNEILALEYAILLNQIVPNKRLSLFWVLFIILATIGSIFCLFLIIFIALAIQRILKRRKASQVPYDSIDER